LDAGTRLGHFTIVSPLGKGGMGEVWRARDTVLGREVALKTLPRELSRDSERLARFEREARLLAAVSHPNIAAIYGLEQHADERFLVLELIEGDTLAERLARGALPITDSLKLALQIAEALEAAHDKSVVHRDLKPANIKINREGKIKVLDFGLAKALASSVHGAARAQTLTMQRDATDQGMILGTAAYMAPEQARGEPVDVRADIWAFGCVLFEMLTGRSTFEGRTVTDVLAGVLRAEPDWGRLPPSLHPRVRYLLERCLEKEPRNRYVGIADARVEIEKVLAAPLGALASTVGTGAARATARWTAVTAGAAVVAALAVAAFVWSPNRTGDLPVVRFTQRLDVPNTAVLEVPLVDISRDGTRVAYASGRGIIVRDLDEPEPRPVQGVTGTPFTPRFSPDGQSLAYGRGPPPYALMTMPLVGGAPQTLVSELAAVPHGLDWARPDALLYVQPEGIMQVSIEGGEPRVVVPAAAGETLGSPHLLPGGDALLYTLTTAQGAARWDAGQVVIQSLGTNERRVVLRGASDARYVASGHLVYAQGSALWAVPFDLRAGEVTGSAVQVIDRVSRAPNDVPWSDTAQYTISESGTLAYLDAPGSRSQAIARELAWVKRDGNRETIPVQSKDFTFARVSPDGTRVAIVVGDAFEGRRSDIWILEVRPPSLRQLTFDLAAEFPFWARDGSRLYFRATDGGKTVFYAVAAEGGPAELIADPGVTFAVPYEIAPDRQTILLGVFRPGNVTIATLGLGDRKLRELFDDPGQQGGAQIAPNGAWIVYQDDAARVVARSYPDVRRARVPDRAGTQPVFSQDGSELFYLSDGGIVVAAVDYEPSLGIGAPRTLFGGDYLYGPRGRAWDPHPDGDRFLMIQNAPEVDAAATLHVAVNWLEELQRRAPAR
jgi:serine/threonine-protein kinase